MFAMDEYNSYNNQHNSLYSNQAPNQMQTKKVPGFVKFIAILNLLAAVFFLFIGIVSKIFSITSLPTGSTTSSGSISFVGLKIPLPVGILSTIIPIAIAMLFIIIGIGLWKGKSWARWIQILLLFIAIIFSIISLVQGAIGSSIANIVINGALDLYLLFNQKVKTAFS